MKFKQMTKNRYFICITASCLLLGGCTNMAEYEYFPGETFIEQSESSQEESSSSSTTHSRENPSNNETKVVKSEEKTLEASSQAISKSEGDYQDSNIGKNADDDKNDAATQDTSEDGFHSDWREGHENFYGYGQTEDWNRSGRQQNFIVQNQWLYYSSGSKIYKMTIGGKAADIQIIYDSKSEYDEDLAPLRIAVAKDWVYFYRTYDGLYKIRTDGTELRKLLDQEQMVMESYFDYDGLGYYALFDNECC